MNYARANLFVAKYKASKEGHIALPEGTTVRLLRGRAEPWGWVSEPNGEPWLIVDDGGDFWPVMIRLEKKEVLDIEDYFWHGDKAFSGAFNESPEDDEE